ncbi:serine/threonineprotein kinase [Pelomyxa schiedti]|nr:serine/threonineprotein kinase [Pelomyxa schiedti]
MPLRLQHHQQQQPHHRTGASSSSMPPPSSHSHHSAIPPPPPFLQNQSSSCSPARGGSSNMFQAPNHSQNHQWQLKGEGGSSSCSASPSQSPLVSPQLSPAASPLISYMFLPPATQNPPIPPPIPQAQVLPATVLVTPPTSQQAIAAPSSPPKTRKYSSSCSAVTPSPGFFQKLFGRKDRTRQRSSSDIPDSPCESPPPLILQTAVTSAPTIQYDTLLILLCDKYAWPCLRYHIEKREPHLDAVCDASFAHECASALASHTCNPSCNPTSIPPASSTNTTIEAPFTPNSHTASNEYSRYCPHALEEVYYRYENQLSLPLRQKVLENQENVNVAVKSFVLALEIMDTESLNSFFQAYPVFTPQAEYGNGPSSVEDASQSLVTSGEQHNSFTEERVALPESGNSDFADVSPRTRIHLAKTQKILIISPDTTGVGSIKRGACTTENCECDQYYGTNYGGLCQNCGHSPPFHENTGPVDCLPPSKSLQSSGESTPSPSIEQGSLTASAPVTGTSLRESPPSLKTSAPERTHPVPHSSSRSERNASSRSERRESHSPSPSRKSSPMKDAQQWAIQWSEIKQHIEKQPFGAGSFAKLYKGVWRNQYVAVKVLKEKPDSRAIQDFKKEFSLLSELRSPNIVYFYGAVLEPRICLVLEYCSRGSLETVMKSDTAFTWENVFMYACDTLRGLSCLHSWVPQLLHRDLKSSNILIADNGSAKLCDFGTTRINDDSETLYKVRGTYAYSCPEVFTGGIHTDKSDIYSFSIILWEMVVRCLKGEHVRPYSEYTMIQAEFQILVQVAQKRIRPTIPSSCPQVLSSFLQTCWSAVPYSRPTCYEALHVLEDGFALYTTKQKKWNKLREKEKKHRNE